MKKPIILGCMFLVAASFSAQEKVQKDIKPIKNTKAEIVNPIKPEVFKKEDRPTYKVTPVAEIKFETSKSKSRASKSSIRESKGKTSNQDKIEPISKPEINKPSKNSTRASKSSIEASKGKSSNQSKVEPIIKKDRKSKANRVNTTRPEKSNKEN